MNDRYSRAHVEKILKRAGIPAAQLDAILGEISFPIENGALRTFLLSFGITLDFLIDRIGGSP